MRWIYRVEYGGCLQMCAAGCQILCSSVSLEGLTISRLSSVLLHFSFSVSENK